MPVTGVLVDFRPDLFCAVAVSLKAPEGDPRVDDRFHIENISQRDNIVNFKEYKLRDGFVEREFRLRAPAPATPPPPP
jgi:hypothetical protein